MTTKNLNIKIDKKHPNVSESQMFLNMEKLLNKVKNKSMVEKKEIQIEIEKIYSLWVVNTKDGSISFKTDTRVHWLINEFWTDNAEHYTKVISLHVNIFKQVATKLFPKNKIFLEFLNKFEFFKPKVLFTQTVIQLLSLTYSSRIQNIETPEVPEYTLRNTVIFDIELQLIRSLEFIPIGETQASEQQLTFLKNSPSIDFKELPKKILINYSIPATDPKWTIDEVVVFHKGVLKEISDHSIILTEEIKDALNKMAAGIIQELSGLNTPSILISNISREKSKFSSDKNWISNKTIELNSEVVDSDLKEEMLQHFFLTNHLPMIVPPNDWTRPRLDDGGFLLNKIFKTEKLVHPFSQGKYDYSISSKAVNSINILQKKSYSLDPYICNKSFWFGDLMLKELEILSEKDRNTLKEELGKIVLNDKISPLKLAIYSKKKKELIDKLKKSLISYDKFQEEKDSLRQEVGLTKFQIHSFFRSKEIKKTLSISTTKFFHHSFVYKIVCLYSGFELFFPSFYCFRFRNYPVGWSVHRAAGAYKYALISTQKHVYNGGTTNSGYLYLKRAAAALFGYKSKMNRSYEEFFDVFKTDMLANNITEDIKKTFPDCIFKTELAFHLVALEINNFISHYKNEDLLALNNKDYIKQDYSSGFLLEIDQNNSGPQILSLLSTDWDLGRKTNILSEFTEKIPVLLLTKINQIPYVKYETKEKNNHNNYPTVAISGDKLDLYEDWLKTIKSTVLIKYTLSIDFLNLFNRKWAKGIIMPFYYNQSFHGVQEYNNRLIFTFENYDKYPSDISQIKISDFNRELFNTLKNLGVLSFNFKNNFLEFVNFLSDRNKVIRLKLLCGSIISFGYLKVERTNTSVKTSAGWKKFSFYKTTTEIDSRKQQISFSPNLIHSIDGAIVRLVLRDFFENHGEIIEPLHDAFRVHPVLLDKLLICLERVYKKEFKDVDQFLICNLLEPNLADLSQDDSKLLSNMFTKLFNVYSDKDNKKLFHESCFNGWNLNSYGTSAFWF